MFDIYKRRVKTSGSKDDKNLNPEQKPDPREYSTTIEPAEVPCQKEAYYYALNKLVREGDRVLDVGSGLGYGMAILSVTASEARGIDVDKKGVKYARNEYIGKNPKIKSIDVYDGVKIPFEDNAFNVVTCIDVLEHVEDYDSFLEELMRVSSGYVLISTPNRLPEYTNPDGTPKNYWHLREWNFEELDEILKRHANSVDWRFIDGPFEGPFKVREQSGSSTLVLMPIINIQENKRG